MTAAALAILALAVVGADAQRRGPRALALALGFVLGTLAAGAGAMIGLVGLVVEGPSPKSIFGLVGFAGGLALTVISAVALLRLPRRWWRLADVPAALIVAQFWLVPLVGPMLSSYAPRPAFTAQPPAGATTVEFTASDGVRLAAWYTPTSIGATVIVLPGAGGTKAGVQAQAAVLTRYGFGVLAMDPRGLGESGGHPHLWGWGGDRDVAAAVDWLSARTEARSGRIGVLGLSMGGEVAITAAARDTRIEAVVAEGATARTCADQSILPNDLTGTIHRADSCLGYALSAAMTGLPEPAPLADSIRAIGSRPVFLIAADLPTEHAATKSWRALAPASVELWEPAGAGHTGALSAYPAEWETHVLVYFLATLLG